jgi:pyridoxamine 5'-phosphate oxidase
MENNLFDVRKEYRLQKLIIDETQSNPYKQFHIWFEQAIDSKVPEPNAMSFSTADSDGRPSSRMVLLKKYDENGFVFFTNYNSRKGNQINTNPFGALLFFWAELERQVRIEGKLVKINAQESDEYFYQRPEGSRIGAWSSPQSEPIPNRSYLENLEKDYKKIFKGKKITRPEHWGGYCLIPERYEFWQGRENRLHDRIEYQKQGNIWNIARLAP